MKYPVLTFYEHGAYINWRFLQKYPRVQFESRIAVSIKTTSSSRIKETGWTDSFLVRRRKEEQLSYFFKYSFLASAIST